MRGRIFDREVEGDKNGLKKSFSGQRLRKFVGMLRVKSGEHIKLLFCFIDGPGNLGRSFLQHT